MFSQRNDAMQELSVRFGGTVPNLTFGFVELVRTTAQSANPVLEARPCAFIKLVCEAEMSRLPAASAFALDRLF